MLNNKIDSESKLWDKKYEKNTDYNSLEDFHKFACINPTVIAIKPYIKDDMNILEVGSGTGELISYIQYAYPRIKTFGIDFSPVSISNSTEFSKKFNLPVVFTQSDILNMPFENDYFDIVFGDQVLAHLDNPDNALKEIYRVTKKGGIVAFTGANKLRPDGWYLYKKLSKTHEGYKQESFFPWELGGLLSTAGFNSRNYYGEVLILTRNLKLIKNLFVKKGDTKKDFIGTVKTNSVKSKSLLKEFYYFIDRIFPSILKVTVGVLARK